MASGRVPNTERMRITIRILSRDAGEKTRPAVMKVAMTDKPLLDAMQPETDRKSAKRGQSRVSSQILPIRFSAEAVLGSTQRRARVRSRRLSARFRCRGDRR
jgi:hypothetical protein